MASKGSTAKPEEKTAKSKRTPASATGARAPASGHRSDSTKGAPAAAEPAAAPETVDLLEPKKKVKRTEAEKAAARPRSMLPPISKIAAPKQPEAVAPPKPVEPPAAPEAQPARDVAEASIESPKAIPELPPEIPVEAPPAVDEKKVIHIKPPIVVKELAVLLGMKPFQVIADLMDLNIFAAINQTIEPDVAAKVCEKHGFVFERDKRQHGAGIHKPEPVAYAPPPPPKEEKKEALELRAPIITFMGHVDHGKTSLLDAIRKARVAAGEAGGITQHIGAYGVERNGKKITFLDTPGHAAFTAMRARGANVTDIVVLVIAADDGVMPQTIEALNHAKAAKVTIMVALNKVDLPGANPDKVKRQLQEHGLAPDDWGGDTVFCEVSATKGTGIDHLLEMMTLQADVLELKANPNADPRCTVIEAQVEQGRGPTATVIVRSGTLKVGQAFISGSYWGKIKQLISDTGRPVKEAGPATPVKVLGFTGLPHAGDELVVMESERSARGLSEERLDKLRHETLVAPQRATLENLFKNLADDQKKVLQIVLKADVQGSMEAISTSLKEIKSDKVSLDIIHSAVGPITDSDVLLASASNAVIVGFGVKVESTASAAAKREGVQIKLYSIIYELIDQMKDAMAGLLDPELRESIIGHAEVRQVFDLTRGRVAGCMVTHGRIARDGRARVLRRRQPIYDGGIATLRRFQDDVKEVRTGLECGIRLGDFSEYETGDIIECYTLEKVAQHL